MKGGKKRRQTCFYRQGKDTLTAIIMVSKLKMCRNSLKMPLKMCRHVAAVTVGAEDELRRVRGHHEVLPRRL